MRDVKLDGPVVTVVAPRSSRNFIPSLEKKSFHRPRSLSSANSSRTQRAPRMPLRPPPRAAHAVRKPSTFSCETHRIRRSAARAGQHGMAHARWHHLPDALPAWMPLTSPQATACRHHPSRQTSTASVIRRRSSKRPPDQSEPTGGSRQGHAGSTRRAIHSTRRTG